MWSYTIDRWHSTGFETLERMFLALFPINLIEYISIMNKDICIQRLGGVKIEQKARDRNMKKSIFLFSARRRTKEQDIT